MNKAFDWVEVRVQKDSEPAYCVLKIYPVYKRGYVTHQFLWWSWKSFEYLNMSEANCKVYNKAIRHAHRYLADCSAVIVSIWSVVGTKEHNTMTWLSEIYNEQCN